MDLKTKNSRSVLFITGLILVCPILYCCVFPFFPGQACLDFVSGRVPAGAESRFLNRIIEDTVNQQFQWISTVSSDQALEELKKIQPQVTNSYDVLAGDDLGGMYERRLKFESGLEIYLVFHGVWPTCPDFRVTDEEIAENLELSHIRVETK